MDIATPEGYGNHEDGANEGEHISKREVTLNWKVTRM